MNASTRNLVAWNDAKVADETIQQVERILGLELTKEGEALWRGAVQELVRDYVLSWVLRPMTRTELASLNADWQEHKRKNKRIIELQHEIARTLTQALTLLFEELNCKGSPRIGLLAKFADRYTDGERLYKDLLALCALGIVAVDYQPPDEKIDRKRGRRSDGLSEFIKCLAKLAHIAGHPLTAPVNTETGRGAVTPFVEAAKLIIDALPGDCPKLTERAIADRIRDEKLLAGMTRQTHAPRKSRTRRRASRPNPKGGN